MNIYLRTISRIDDVKMVRGHLTRAPKACEERALIRAHVANFERALFLLKESLKMPKKLSFYDAKSLICLHLFILLTFVYICLYCLHLFKFVYILHKFCSFLVTYLDHFFTISMHLATFSNNL